MTIDTSLTEQKIQRVLNGFLSQPKYNVDGLYVFKWESDKLLWTKTDYIYEIEIKISRADYKNDFKHKAEKHLLLNSKMPKPSETVQQDLFDNLYKHEKKRWPKVTMEWIHEQKGYPEDTPTPNYFYYAVPEGLIEPDEVPPYAGLIYIRTHKGRFENDPSKWNYDYKVVKPAPQLHKKKYSDAELNLSEKFYYNMKTWQKNYREQVDYSLMYRNRLQDELSSKHQEKSYKELQEDLKYAEDKAQAYRHSAEEFKRLYKVMVEGADYNSIERRVFMDVLEELGVNVKEKYKEIMDRAEQRYKEYYPGRK